MPDNTQEYRITDHLASVRSTLDGTGTITHTYDYKPFGSLFQGGPEAHQSFNSREKDQEAGLFNNGVRKLEDDDGRFTSIDPLWEKFPAWSPYQYGYNNPLTVTDPSGMQGTPTDMAFSFSLFALRHQDNALQVLTGGLGVLGGIAGTIGGATIAGGTGGAAAPVGAGLMTLSVTSTGLSLAKMVDGTANIIQNESRPDEPYKKPAPIPSNFLGGVSEGVKGLTGFELAPLLLGLTESALTLVGSGAPATTLDMAGLTTSQAQAVLDVGQLAFEADKKEKEKKRISAQNSGANINPDAPAHGNTPLPIIQNQ